MADTQAPVFVSREWHGVPAPPGTRLPHPADLVRLCTAVHSERSLWNMGLAYPPESPVFWIKFGPSIIWNELEAQARAREGLIHIQSPVYVPAIFYACELRLPGNPRYHGSDARSYVVMEYAPGRTANELLGDTEDPYKRDDIYASIGLALSELSRIPVPATSRPAAIDGGAIRHLLFDEQEAPVHYQTVQQLEHHLNTYLSRLWDKKTERVKDLTREPLIFCYSDLWLGNFIINEDGRITVIDFADTSILPSSFTKCAFLGSIDKLQRNISDLVTVPSTPGVDNTEALLACLAPMIVSPAAFCEIGVELFGEAAVAGSGDRDERRIETFPQGKPLLDPEGRQVTVSYQELHPEYDELEENRRRSLSPGWLDKMLAEDGIQKAPPPDK